MLGAEVFFLRREHYRGGSGVDGPQHAGFAFKLHRQRFDLAVFEDLQRDLAGNPVTTGEDILQIRRRLVRHAETFHCARHGSAVVQNGGRVHTRPMETNRKGGKK